MNSLRKSLSELIESAQNTVYERHINFLFRSEINQEFDNIKNCPLTVQCRTNAGGTTQQRLGSTFAVGEWGMVRCLTSYRQRSFPRPSRVHSLATCLDSWVSDCIIQETFMRSNFQQLLTPKSLFQLAKLHHRNQNKPSGNFNPTDVNINVGVHVGGQDSENLTSQSHPKE
ncbi:hypothetical protein CEXT_152101 [Caerostris extrusa]|uniref:Uncharacterized protein n=1 Tax=Caerostris extrusa TaxID=172846 RepID=A0AAV4P527_CAEEX|nr:hypothetical protein CEXT_152101 [Caerostris extrusa]